MIAENLDEAGSPHTLALIYAAYEWDRCFPPYAIIQHMAEPTLFREYCVALQKNLRSCFHLHGYSVGMPNIVYHLESGGVSLKPQELAVTALCTKDAPNVQQIILNSLELFLKKELHNVASLSYQIV